MHELGIVEDLVKSIQEKTKDKENFGQIKKIYLRLGKNMNITEESLRFWFENLTQGTKLEGASLEVSLVGGREIVVDSFEVE